MTQKEEYTAWASTQTHLPIFMQPWWMDAVCAGKEWDVLLVRNEDGSILAAMPYLIRKRWWIRYILMPQETAIGGVWMEEKDADKVDQISKEIAAQLVSLSIDYYCQKYPIGSALPKTMELWGFQSYPMVTYRVENLENIEEVISRFSKNKKRQLQKAAALHITTDMTAEQFYSFHKSTLQQRQKSISYTREFLLVLERKTRKANQSQIIAIRDNAGQTYAAALLVWDEHTLYYLIPCYDATYKDSGAGALLVVEAMKIAQAKGLTFDFEGSMIPGVALHYKQFGGLPTTYYRVEKCYAWWFQLPLWFYHLYCKMKGQA